MKWRFPRRQHGFGQVVSMEKIPSEGRDTITNDDFDRAIRGKYQSIYQVDFLGFQPRNVLTVQERSLDESGSQNKNNSLTNDSVGHTLSQSTYRNPAANPNFIRKLHQPPNNRFGCNVLKTVHNPGICELRIKLKMPRES